MGKVDSPKIDREGRETWVGRFDFLMTLIGFSVGLGNLWRFPYLCYKNGGGVFLIPYFIALIGAGVPLLFLEVSLGQFMSRSGISAWNIYPLAKGLGVATVIIVFYLSLYYIVVIAWTVYYLFSTMTFDDMPWTKCGEDLGPSCRDNISEIANKTGLFEPPQLFWSERVLGLSDGIESLGGIQTHMAASLLVSWLLVYVCIIRGVQWTGKIVWFTGLFPYFMLIILFIRGLTLEGSWDGIKYYLNPDISKLSEGSVWLDAGTQIFFSMSLAGSMLTLGSYNEFSHNCLRDCLLFSVINCSTSIFGGLCIFSVLGYMAHESDIPIKKVAEGGPGLTFIAYPKALSLMPVGAKFLTALFFLMILFLGLDSQFVSIEGLIAQIMDAFPKFFRFKCARQIVITFVCVLFYIVGLIFATNGGMYFFQVMDFYSASGFVLLIVCFCESITIAYLYGGRRYIRDLEAMMNIKIPAYFLFCWRFTTPLICIFIGVMYWVQFTPLSLGDYVFPIWSRATGWAIVASSTLAIPITALYQIYVNRGNIAAVRTALLKEHQIHSQSQQPFEVILKEGSGETESFPVNAVYDVEFINVDSKEAAFHSSV